MSYPREGGCQCGAVRYRVSAPPVRITACFCTECQKQSGSAFGLSFAVRETDFALIQGEPKRWTRGSDSGGEVTGVFCGTCGTRLWHEIAIPGVLNIKPGTLDDTSDVKPVAAAYVARKGDWLELNGLARTFERGVNS